MSDVIGFEDFIQNRILMTPPISGDGQVSRQTTFTPRDRDDLEEWSTEAHWVSVCASDMGAFAMVHQAGRPWASWGVARQGRSVLLWDCVTHSDIGRFASMVDALAAVPIDDFPAPVANIIQFAAARTRTAAIG